MAALEKLHKALEALKIIHSSGPMADDVSSKSKEKISLCVVVADMMCSPDTKNAPNFTYLLSYSLEMLLKLCDDQDSNIRMIADECLNRIIRVQMHANVSKINLILHKEIRKNGSARSLRAALWRFAELAHLIRPAKGRPYIQTLVPCIMKIAARTEETVLETLASALPKILQSLGPFMNDNETKQFINTFIKNIHSENAVMRRTAASSIVGICAHSPKSQAFVIHTINALLDSVLPVKEDLSVYTILGVLNCLRGLLPLVSNDGKESYLRGSFGVKRKTNKQVSLSVDSIIQVYELCFHWTCHADHNVITAALETLNELLTAPPRDFIPILIENQGLGRSRILTAPLKKLTSKALSEVSVATISAVDDSQLLDADEELPTTKVSNWLDESLPEPHMSPSHLPYHKTLLSHGTLESLTDYPDSEASEDISLMLKEEARQHSPEPEVFSRDSPSPPPHTDVIIDWDIGSAIESDVSPLVFCARRLVTAFLIPECSVRVSIRALALSCLCQVLRLYPSVFVEKLDKRGQKTPQGFAHVYDVVRLCEHSDPQLRGLCRMVIGHFINSMYHHGFSCSSSWSKQLTGLNENVDLDFLTSLLIGGLEDESSVTVRHSLTGLTICLSSIIESSDFAYSVPILEKILKLVDNPYWLIKAKLVELLCRLPYQCIYYATGSSDFQNKVLRIVIPNLMGNEDNRVRKTTAESIIKLIDQLYFTDDYAEDDITVARGSTLSSSIFSNIYRLRQDHVDPSVIKMREKKLSRIVEALVQALLFSSSKHLSHGCIEVLALLSKEYHPSEFPNGWFGSCGGPDSDSVPSSGLFNVIVTLLSHSPVSLDLECHQWLLMLAGNLFNGLFSHLEASETVDTKLLKVSEELLTHVMRILYMFHLVTEEGAHQSRLTRLSPLRRKTHKPLYAPNKPSDEENKDDKWKLVGAFIGNRQCYKILDIIRAGYTNYKLTLDPGSSEKLVNLITHALLCMEQLLIHLKIVEPALVAEELLTYLSYTFVLDSTATIFVVNQLMKSLFEQKFPPPATSASTKNSSEPEKPDPCYGLYANIIQKPMQELSDHLDASHKPLSTKNHEEAAEKGKPTVKYDRQDMSKKIKLFENIVIQALKEYTMSNNVKLQVEVLRLLTLLVKLKVNYCLLDSDQVFIKFVKGQFEYIEAGQIHDAELLIPQIFKFLVHLSNEKNHSKPVISIPEIIQLCDGLMASGQNPVTHSIPALLPVVEHIFLLNVSNIDINELETQREVILAMLVRLAEFPQVLDILNKVMKEGWRWEEHWKRWYRQTVDTILPLLAEGKLLVNDINALHSLLSLNSSFVAPLNYVLVLLFSHQDGQTIVQWLGMVTTMLLSVCLYKEERVLIQLEEMNLYVREEGDDPLSVNTVSKTLPPQQLLAKLVIRVVLTAVTKLQHYVEKYCEPGQIEDLEKTFANFLLCCIYLFQQGNYEELSKSLSSLLKETGDIETINKNFLIVAYKCPLLTILWADILMLLDHGEPAFWEPLLGSNQQMKRRSLNLEVVRQGSVILYCEYLAKKQQDVKALSWLLDHHVEEVVWNCPELPVEKLLCSIYNLERNSKLLLDATSKCVQHTEPIFTHRLLQTLENVHSNYTGSVLNLVALSLVKHRNIAIARLAAAFCCRTIEYMLTLEKTSVLGLFKKDELLHLYKTLKSDRKQCKRYSGLVSVLKKLGEEVYGISKWESDDDRSVDVAVVKNLKLDNHWLVEQIRQRCSIDANPDGVRCTRLLSTLEEDDLDALFLSDNFDKSILQHCFFVGTQIKVQWKGVVTCDSLPAVYKSARKVLMKNIHEICDALPVTYNNIKPGAPESYEQHLDTLLSRLSVKHQLLPLAMAINNYLTSVNNLNNANTDFEKYLPSQSHLDLVRFALLCIRVSESMTRADQETNTPTSPSDVQNIVESSCKILSFDLLASHLKLEEIYLILKSVLSVVPAITGDKLELKEFKTESDPQPKGIFLDVSIFMATLLSWVDRFPYSSSNLPNRIEYSLKALMISFGRLNKLNVVCRLPVEAWQTPLDAEIPPPIPLHILHEPEILHLIVNRIRLLGWTNRLQFEEMWVCLLSALTPNPNVDNTDQEEISAIMHANSLAVDGITWLVLSALAVNTGNSFPPKLLHVPRCGNHKLHLLQFWERLEELNDILYWKLQPTCGRWHLNLICADKRPNLERLENSDRYGFGQLSVAFLQAQISPADDSPTVEENQPEEPKRPGGGIDVRSCLQFVLDLYGQWVLPNSGISLNLQLSMVKSVVYLSDMFSEVGHYEWMFHTLYAMSKSHPLHDEIMHQYLVIGIAKSAAVLQIVEGENSDKVIKVVENALKNSCSSIRVAGIHGLLYLLQTAKTIKKVEGAADVPKLSPGEFRARLLSLCCDFVDKHFTEEAASSSDCSLLIALSLFLLEIFPNEVTSPQNIIKTCLHLAQNAHDKCVYQTVINGLERLVLTGSCEPFKEQITRLALDRFSQPDPSISLPALQLLISCIYSGKVGKDQPGADAAMLPSDTEIMEKTSALFSKIKKGYPIEVEIVCEILPSILSDFFPVLDVSTKVIGEFLTPSQPHKKDMAAMVFQVFTQACNEKQLPLLQDWVVHSLNSFTQNLPLVTAVWSLCCFFISASANPWLRAIFPHVQSRIRQCEYEDKEIFSIAAVQFYSQLNESQRRIFLKSFKNTTSSQMSPFSDVIACLS